MLPDMPSNDDANEVAAYLVRKNGLEGARLIAMDGTSSANAEGDMLRLSVWRQVKAILRDWDSADVGDAEA
ncbi:MAG: hypothetical protein ACI9JL_004270 [Paracoccaceae bacterium]|jgi:hypothetical protein